MPVSIPPFLGKNAYIPTTGYHAQSRLLLSDICDSVHAHLILFKGQLVLHTIGNRLLVDSFLRLIKRIDHVREKATQRPDFYFFHGDNERFAIGGKRDGCTPVQLKAVFLRVLRRMYVGPGAGNVRRSAASAPREYFLPIAQDGHHRLPVIDEIFFNLEPSLHIASYLVLALNKIRARCIFRPVVLAKALAGKQEKRKKETAKNGGANQKKASFTGLERCTQLTWTGIELYRFHGMDWFK